MQYIKIINTANIKYFKPTRRLYSYLILILTAFIAINIYLIICDVYREKLIQTKLHSFQIEKSQSAYKILHENEQYLQHYDKLIKRDCCKTSNLTQNEYAKLNNFINFLNRNQFNYFTCLSTLYYAVKIESYIVYRDYELNRHVRDLLDLEKHTKCILDNGNDGVRSKQIHLCLMNDYTDKKNIKKNFCAYINALLKGFHCEYNYLNGNYLIKFGSQFEFVLHEYIKLKDFDDLNVKVKLNTGLIGYFFNLNLDMPKYMFYDGVGNRDTHDHEHDHGHVAEQQSESNFKYFYANYAGMKLRLPAEILNYFMLVYPELWYK